MSLKKIGLACLALFIFLQLFRIDKTPVAVNPDRDFMSLKGDKGHRDSLLAEACYDCHSNQVRYPWYTNIAPISWWIKHHINEGKHHLNFSEWATYDSKRQDHKLEECVEMLEKDEMPMASYTIIHEKARLSYADRKILVDWFNTLRTGESEELD